MNSIVLQDVFAAPEFVTYGLAALMTLIMITLVVGMVWFLAGADHS